MIRQWFHLQRLRAREFQLAWQADLWPDEDLQPRLDQVRAVRQQAEIGRWLSYPPTRTGSR